MSSRPPNFGTAQVDRAETVRTSDGNTRSEGGQVRLRRVVPVLPLDYRGVGRQVGEQILDPVQPSAPHFASRFRREVWA
jgi:hypothetical protein